MFMRENRRKNGAEQPETTQSRDSGKQRGARKISPNDPLPNKGEDWRFSPQMSTPEAINRGHYTAGVSGEGVYGTSYDSKIPYVGAKPAAPEI